jgi:transposase
MACDGRGLPMVLWLTAGNVNDTTELGALMDGIRVQRVGRGRPRTRPDVLIADKGYSSRANRRMLSARGIRVVIPERDDQAGHRRRRGSMGGRPYQFDPEIYRARNVVERGFNRFKHWRGLASRYDKTAINYLGGLTLASLLLWASA